MSGTVKVKVEVPEGISEQARETAERSAREATVLSLWRAGEISTRDAAAELNLAYHEFLDLLAERDIPVVDGVSDDEALEKARQQLAARKP